MFWLIWQMGVLLLVAFGLGLFFGRQIWSGDARSAEADQALAEASRLRTENENLARRLGESEARKKDVTPQVEPVTAPTAATEVETVEESPAPSEPKAAMPATAPVGEGADDLTQIKGLGPKAAAALHDAGVTRFAQIAAWSDSDVEDWDARINGRGRITRDDWVGQARSLVG